MEQNNLIHRDYNSFPSRIIQNHNHNNLGDHHDPEAASLTTDAAINRNEVLHRRNPQRHYSDSTGVGWCQNRLQTFLGSSRTNYQQQRDVGHPSLPPSGNTSRTTTGIFPAIHAKLPSFGSVFGKVSEETLLNTSTASRVRRHKPASFTAASLSSSSSEYAESKPAAAEDSPRFRSLVRANSTGSKCSAIDAIAREHSTLIPRTQPIVRRRSCGASLASRVSDLPNAAARSFATFTTPSVAEKSGAASSSKGKSTKYTCRAEGCTKWMRKGGYCFAHGGGSICSVDNCNKSSQTAGKCFIHAGKFARCTVKGCYRIVWQLKISEGLCRTCHQNRM